MIAALTLKRLNEIFISKGMPTVATGPIEHECRNIDYARSIFELTGSYRSFLKAFTSVNSMSLIAWAVCQHNDHFNAGGESLENKILFVVPSIKDSIGRGGSFLGRHFVFALLDWRYESRTWRKFYVTHADDMGIGPVQPRGAQTLLTNHFTTAADGPEWQQRFQRFRSTEGRNSRARSRSRGRRTS